MRRQDSTLGPARGDAVDADGDAGLLYRRVHPAHEAQDAVLGSRVVRDAEGLVGRRGGRDDDVAALWLLAHVVHGEGAGVDAGVEVDGEGFEGRLEQVARGVEVFGQVVCVRGYSGVCEDVVYRRVGFLRLFEQA